MSHYTVHVIVPGDTPQDAEMAVEAALEPFDENLDVTPYEEEVRDEEVRRALDFEDTQREARGEPCVDRCEERTVLEVVSGWVGSEVERRDDGVMVHQSTWNPNGHWDWWVLGGRWRGAFTLRAGVSSSRCQEPEWMSRLAGPDPAAVATVAEPQALLGLRAAVGGGEEEFSGRADLARVRDIDLEAMRALAGLAAEERFDAFEAATEGLEPGPRWAEVRSRYAEDGIDEARREYYADPWTAAARQGAFLDDPHEVWCVDRERPREEFVARAVAGVGVPYAWLQDGEWEQQGYIGMFMAGAADQPDQVAAWHAHVAARWAALDGDLWIANVDCHT